MEGGDSIVDKITKSISGFPDMVKGCYIIDDGNLVLSEGEKEELLKDSPESLSLIKKYVGAQEFINGQLRYCLYIPEEK